MYIKENISKTREKLYIKLAWAMPREFIDHCFCRVLAEYTGHHPKVNPNNIKAMTALKAWMARSRNKA